MATSQRAVAIRGGSLAAVLLLAASLIRPWEGYRPQPYLDAVGVVTVCYGHTGEGAGKPHTRAECESLLDADMRTAWQSVERCITVPMTTRQAAALLSAAFNLGPRVVCGSTLQRKANAGDWRGACAELSRWNRAGGRVVAGLTRRREAERALCEGRT